MGNQYDFSIEDLIPGDLELPYTQTVIQNSTIKFKLASAKMSGEMVDWVSIRMQTLENGSSVRCIHVNGELTILFSKPVAQIELAFFVNDHSDFQIIAVSENQE